MTILTQEMVRGLFDYDPASGDLVWRVSKKGNGGAGSVAGCQCKRSGYIIVGIDGRLYRAHRLVWLHVYGELPTADIDHINGIPNDNRIKNLRLCTASQNIANSKHRRNNTSGTKGVYRDTQRNKWAAEIMVHRRKIYLGRFDRLEDAAAAYKNAAHKYFGEFARTA
jgi:hypothetical protein